MDLHPLKARLLMGSERNNERLFHLSEKLEELTTISGHEFVLERLGLAGEYPGALCEMDFILRLKHHDLPTIISRPRDSKLIDIESVLDDRKVKIEITTLRHEDELYGSKAGIAIDEVISLYGLTKGGILAKIPRKPTEFSEIAESLRQASKEASESHKMVKANLAGWFTLYLAPKGMESEIPEEYRGTLEMRSTPISQNKLSHVVLEKARKYHADQEHPIIIAVYDRSELASSEVVGDYLGLELGNLVATFPNVAGVILICSSMGRLKAVRLDEGQTTYIEHSPKSPLEVESERIIIWKNKMYDHGSVIESIIETLTDTKPIEVPWLRFPHS